jgi:hypothetical protein
VVVDAIDSPPPVVVANTAATSEIAATTATIFGCA